MVKLVNKSYPMDSATVDNTADIGQPFGWYHERVLKAEIRSVWNINFFARLLARYGAGSRGRGHGRRLWGRSVGGGGGGGGGHRLAMTTILRSRDGAVKQHLQIFDVNFTASSGSSQKSAFPSR